MIFDCTSRSDVAFQGAAVRGPRHPPQVSVQGLLPSPAGFAFVLTMTYEQALAMRGALQGAIDLIEDEATESASGVRH